MNRFERQIKLSGFGKASQQKLKEAKVLVVGAGGLGCPALIYLASCGVGEIGIADGDVVSVSNLNRQILFGESDIGKLKPEAAKEHLLSKYSNLKITSINEYITQKNAIEIISGYDIVLDGSDNFPVRYLVNDTCVLLNRPLVFGAIYQYEGQLAVFNVPDESKVKTNYRDLFPEPPEQFEVPDCNQTGVIGVLPGVIGTLQAAEVIKLITGIGRPHINRVLIYDLRNSQFYETTLRPDMKTNSKIPKSVEQLKETDYSLACNSIHSITWSEVEKYLGNFSGKAILVDVREHFEVPRFTHYTNVRIPLSELETDQEYFQNYEVIILFCQAGIRSLKAANIISTRFKDKEVYSVYGGLDNPESPVKTLEYAGKI